MTESPSPAYIPYQLSDCQRDDSRYSPGLGWIDQTNVCVVFDDQTINLFSALQIILCCRKEIHERTWRELSIRKAESEVSTILGPQSNSQTNTAPSQLPVQPLNDPTLPKCTVILELIADGSNPRLSIVEPVFRASQDLQLVQQGSVHVLFDHERALPLDTLSVTLSFTHIAVPHHLMRPPPNLTGTHSLRVLPRILTILRAPYRELPTEILLKIFQYIAQAPYYTSWRRDLLSFALVCRKWTCSLDLLLWNLNIVRDERQMMMKSPDIHAIANAVKSRPSLAHSVRHLSTDYLKGKSWPPIPTDPASIPAFASSFITILQSTRNLRSLELMYLDVRQMEALGDALCHLPPLHTFSTGQSNPDSLARCGAISIVQLAYCLASWPSLKSLTIHGLLPPIAKEVEMKVPLRPPACALTEVLLEAVVMGDAELMFFMTPSFKTLERVTFHRVTGISNAGLRTFLNGISQNVSHLTIHSTGMVWPPGTQEPALDAMIDKMPRLRELDIRGIMATELMIHRRASLFRADRTKKDRTDAESLPIVRLSFGAAPGLPATIADNERPGWDISKPSTGPPGGGNQQQYSKLTLDALKRRPSTYLRTILAHANLSSYASQSP